MRRASAALLAALALVPPAAAERFETILRHGTVVDGSGLAPYSADVAIAEGHIARIGRLSRMTANVDIDVAGLYVAPGSIEIDSGPLTAATARADALLERGVTLHAGSAAGGGPANGAALSAGSGSLAVNVGAFTGLDGLATAADGRSPAPPVEEAVRARTAVRAATIGLADRGYLAHGMAADVVVFDAAGSVRHVLVNGVLAFRDGARTGMNGGRVVMGGSGLPARAITADIARRVIAKGNAGSLVLDIDVSQARGDRQARGRATIRIPDADQRLAVADFGVLQVAGDWASFTAEAKVAPEGHVRPITVILDRTKPGAGAMVILEIDGARAFQGAIARDAIRLLPPPR
jgi:hypothetical protein